MCIAIQVIKLAEGIVLSVLIVRNRPLKVRVMHGSEYKVHLLSWDNKISLNLHILSTKSMRDFSNHIHTTANRTSLSGSAH